MKAFKLMIFQNKIFVLLAAFLINSCTQIEPVDPTVVDVINEELSTQELDNNSFLNMRISTNPNCANCFEAGGISVETIKQLDVMWGGPNGERFSKTVDLKVSNSEENLILRVKSSEFIADLKIRYPGETEFISIKDIDGIYSAGAWIEKQIPLPTAWEGCQEFDFELAVIGNGPQALFEVNYELAGVCEIDETPTVTIGDQVWMLKNLDVDTYRNGDPIFQATTQEELESANARGEGAWVYYNFDEENGKIYGKLYNLAALTDPRGVAPIGWRIPKEEELFFIAQNDGGKLKSTGTIQEGTGLWQFPNFGATNETGFTGLPAGAWLDPSLGSGGAGFIQLGFLTAYWVEVTFGYGYIPLTFDSNRIGLGTDNTSSLYLTLRLVQE